MKELTNKELNKAPGIIQFIYLMSKFKIPSISIEILNKAKEKHPAYFIKTAQIGILQI